MRLVDLAPFCSLPPRDGADKRAWNLYSGLIAGGVPGSFVGRHATVTNLASPEPHSPARSWRDRKSLCALAALVLGRDYWEFKSITPRMHRITREAARLEPDTVLLNFLFSLPLVQAFAGRRVRLVVDTHNYDPGVFAGFAAAAGNPLTRLLCHRAIRNSRKALKALPTGTVMVYVSESDAEAWRRERSDLAHEVVENGCTVRPRVSAPDYSAPGKKRLIFVGSLSAQMNQDALRNFATQFWPALKDVASLQVVGSNPPASVSELCRQEGWELRPNVTEEQLEAAFETAHFSVMPFAYGAGSKLKLMEACGRGMPVLSTPAGVVGVSQPPPLIRVDDRAETWRSALLRTTALEPEALRATLEFAQRFSWPRLADRLQTVLRQAPEVSVT